MAGFALSSSYRIVEKLCQGGIGLAYTAEVTHLHRSRPQLALLPVCAERLPSYHRVWLKPIRPPGQSILALSHC
jgi:hypothetical protein